MRTLIDRPLRPKDRLVHSSWDIEEFETSYYEYVGPAGPGFVPGHLEFVSASGWRSVYSPSTFSAEEGWQFWTKDKRKVTGFAKFMRKTEGVNA